MPIAPTFNDDSDFTLAVNLSGPPVDDPAALLGTREESEDAPNGSGLRQKLDDFIADLQESFNSGDRNLGMYDVGSQAFDAMQGAIARHKLAAYPPDHTIEIPRNVCGTLDFDTAEALIRLGRERTREWLDQLSV